MLLLVFRIFYTRPRLIASIIEDDIKLITLALEKIDSKCNILTISKGNSHVDFLNVKSFEGSQIGSLVLAYPDRWEGPYLSVNPTIQDKFYEIVRAKGGAFVLPGTGVTLPNGKVIGKDFKITERTDVEIMFQENGLLRYGDKVLGGKLMFKVGDWDSWHLNKETVESFDRMLKEFHEAMPYTKNEQSLGSVS